MPFLHLLVSVFCICLLWCKKQFMDLSLGCINSYRVLPPSDCAYTYTMCLGVLLLSAWYWKSARNIKHDGSCFGSFANPARPDNKLTLHRILSGSNLQSLVGLKPSEVQVQERPAEPYLFICLFAYLFFCNKQQNKQVPCGDRCSSATIIKL